MKPLARELFQMAIDAAKDTVPDETPTSILCEWEISCRAESMARELAECAAYQLRQVPKRWDMLPQEVQNRFRQLAERTILQIDLSVRERAMAQAIKETEDYMDGPYDGVVPTTRDICREVLNAYEAILCAGAPDQSVKL